MNSEPSAHGRAAEWVPDNLEELQRELARVVAEKNMLEADAARRAGEIQSSPSPCDREGEGTACAVEAQMQVASWSAGDESDDESEETPVLCIGRHSWRKVGRWRRRGRQAQLGKQVLRPNCRAAGA